MGIRIAVYGIGKRTEKFLSILETRQEKIDIAYFVQSHKSKEQFYGKKVIEAEEINYEEIDYLIISSNVHYEEIFQHLKKVCISYEVYQNKVMIYSDFLMKLSPKDMPYQSCRVEGGIVYIASSDDRLIPQDMLETGKNFSEDSIKAFFELTNQYYGEELCSPVGYFLDIGANIGTTSIYVKKMMNRNLKIVGFEPCKKNYDLFRVNCILNQTEDIRGELLGLSNSNTVHYFEYNSANSGGSKIIMDKKPGKEFSKIDVMKLDDYLEKERISPFEVSYIWIDVEGHEYEVLEGAARTLITKKIPLLQEFNPITYLNNNVLEKYCELMKGLYMNFIDVNEYIDEKYSTYNVCELYQFAMNMKENHRKQTDLFFF